MSSYRSSYHQLRSFTNPSNKREDENKENRKPFKKNKKNHNNSAIPKTSRLYFDWNYKGEKLHQLSITMIEGDRSQRLLTQLYNEAARYVWRDNEFRLFGTINGRPYQLVSEDILLRLIDEQNGPTTPIFTPATAITVPSTVIYRPPIEYPPVPNAIPITVPLHRPMSPSESLLSCSLPSFSGGSPCPSPSGDTQSYGMPVQNYSNKPYDYNDESTPLPPTNTRASFTPLGNWFGNNPYNGHNTY